MNSGGLLVPPPFPQLKGGLCAVLGLAGQPVEEFFGDAAIAALQEQAVGGTPHDGKVDGR
jgi:hypothetical protein